jgi:hypothetical protein
VCIISGRNTDHMKFAACMTVAFITFFHILLVLSCITVYMVLCFECFCLICKLCILIVMFIYSYCYVYVFLLLCMFCSVLGILFHCVVMCTVCV